MAKNGDARWTIDELAAEVAAALAGGYEGTADRRIRDVPDLRTIRYYTTLGLLDRPAELRGRTALYGRRHLMQLVAIKRLQARGLPLAAIQERLLGLTDAKLRATAELPSDLDLDRPAHIPSPRRRASFWAARPAPLRAAATAGDGEPRALQGVRLEEGVLLLLERAHPLEAAEVQALRAASLPLLDLLKTRRLLRRPRKGAPS